jgi:prepilin-type processing-associated H-X9-DG protein
MSATGSNYPLYFYNPSVTPDGRRVVFTANHGGQSNIYFVDWEGDDKADGGPGRA